MTPDEKHVCYRDGFKPGRLYELIYRAKDPTVGGLGFAATRDLGAFLRNSEKDDAGAANPVYRPDNLAIIEGSSQSGRMIRSLLALGFNRDETGAACSTAPFRISAAASCRSTFASASPCGPGASRPIISIRPTISLSPMRGRPIL